MKQIDQFWSWFQKNEETFLRSVQLGFEIDGVFSLLDKRLQRISKRIHFLIGMPADDESYTIIFSGDGYTKLFPKILALELQAPELVHFKVQAFIKPLEDKTDIVAGTDAPYEFGSYSIRISALYLSLTEYDLRRKWLKIKIHLPDYDTLIHYEDLRSNLKLMVMEIIGEIAYRKHLKQIEVVALPDNINGLLGLIELPDCIDYLYQINSRGRTREI